MLELIAAEMFRADVFRLASQRRHTDFLRAEGFDDESVQEMLELLASRGISDTPDDLLSGPFRPKPQLRKSGYRTRFSDGSFPVFYSSLEMETAEAEVAFWFLKNISEPTKRRTAYYTRLSCRFDGLIKDLRSALANRAELTDDSDYSFCNSVGAEAVTSGLDGLVTPSARADGGTNLPVFTQRALSNPSVRGLMALTLDPSTGKVAVREDAAQGP